MACWRDGRRRFDPNVTPNTSITVAAMTSAAPFRRVPPPGTCSRCMGDVMGTTESPAFERPTRVRYGVLGFLCSLAFVLYIDRVCISQAAPSIQAELDLTNTQMSFVF